MVNMYIKLTNDIKRYQDKREDYIGPVTVKNQVLVLENFARYLTMNNIESFKKVKVKTIEAYLKSKNARSTKEAYRTVLKLFYNHLYPDLNLIDNIERFKNNSKHKIQTFDDIITPKKIQEAFKGPLRYPNRDKAMILSLWESNARANEFLKLKIGDIKIENGITTFKLQSEKRRDNILIREIDCEMCTPFIQDWLDLGHPLPNDPEAPLWVSLGKGKKGTPLGYHGLFYVCKSAFGKSPHYLRHSRSTYLALNGATEIQLMSHGGWSQPNMVYHYTRLAKRRAGKSIGVKNGDTADKLINDMQGEFKDISKFQKAEKQYQDQQIQLTQLNAKLTKMENEMGTQKDFITELMGNPDVQVAMLSAMKSKSVNGDKVLEL